MINKKLLSEVLKTELQNPYLKLIDPYLDGDIIHYATVSGQESYSTRSYNIYELAHKCKEWAFNNGFYIVSIFCGDTYHITLSTNDKGYIWANCNNTTYISKKEIDAIIDACQFILQKNT